MDFPKLLNELFTSSFSSSAVSGGFRRAGVWPFNEESMKEKVVRQRSSDNNSTTNQSSTMDVLSSLLHEIGTPDIDVDNSDDSLAPARTNTNSTSSSSRHQLTFDDDESDSDQSIDIEPPNSKKSTYNNTSEQDSDENMEFSSNQKSSNLTGTSTKARMSPISAAQSIISSYSRHTNIPTPPPPTKTNSRIRVERKFGEVITSGNLLEELKQKAEAKKTKQLKHKGNQKSQRSLKK